MPFILKRGQLQKERVCSHWEQTLSFLSWLHFWRDLVFSVDESKHEVPKVVSFVDYGGKSTKYIKYIYICSTICHHFVSRQQRLWSDNADLALHYLHMPWGHIFRPWGYKTFFHAQPNWAWNFTWSLKIKIPTIITFFHTQLSWACLTELSMKEALKKCQYFKINKQSKIHAQLSWAWKKFYNLGARLRDQSVLFR